MISNTILEKKLNEFKEGFWEYYLIKRPRTMPLVATEAGYNTEFQKLESKWEISYQTLVFKGLHADIKRIIDFYSEAIESSVATNKFSVEFHVQHGHHLYRSYGYLWRK